MNLYGIVGAAFLAGAIPSMEYRPDRDGAQTRIGISVVDDLGDAVQDAKVYVKFFTTFEKFYIKEMTTDKGGYAECSGTTRGEVVVRIEKDHFYHTTSHVKYQDVSWDDAVASRKWAKGVVISKMKLKRIRDPQKKRLASVDMKKPPLTEKTVPFDILAADWCAPYGKGRVNDINFNFCREDATNYVAYTGMRMELPNCVDGLYAAEIEDWSKFRYCYAANTNAIYSKCLEMGKLPENHPDALVQSGCDQKRYHVIRFRTVTNEVGHIVSARYGLILEGLDYSGGLSMAVQVNIGENDINLEDESAERIMNKMKRRNRDNAPKPPIL